MSTEPQPELTLSDTTPLPTVQPGYSVQRNELKNIEFFDWFSDKIFPVMLQAAAMILVTAAGLSTSAAAIPIAGVAMLGFELGRAHLRNKADLNRELLLYHNDIAEVLGKAPDEKLTLQDMYKAADEKQVGDKALKPLKLELDHLKYRSRYNMTMGTLRAAVTTAGAIVLSGSMQFSMRQLGEKAITEVGDRVLMSLMGTLATIGGITMGLEKLGKSYFHNHEPVSVYPDLMRLKDKVKSQAIKPEQVFDITIKLDTELAKEIEQKVGMPYNELTFSNKEKVIKAFEKYAHTQALTDSINAGTHSVTAIARTAFNQMEWPEPKTEINKSEKESSPARTPDLRLAAELLRKTEAITKSFVAELSIERGETPVRVERS